MAKISIIVPVYNVDKYLRHCLDSLINQTLQDIEIICINDGSTDNSLPILEEYALRDNRVTVITKPNTGYGHSMNVGLGEASGDYIGIVESDDFAAAEMFDSLYTAAYENSADVVKSNFIRYKTSPALEMEYHEILKDFRYDTVFSPADETNIFFMQTHSIWSAIYKRDFLEKNNIRFHETSGASYQDTSFSFKVWASAERVLLIKNAYLHYRVDNANASVKSPAKVFCVCDEYDEIQRFLDKKNILKERYKYLVEVLKFRTYQWNYRRLSPDYKYDFLLRFADEFRKARTKRLLRQEYWSEQEWLAVHKLMENPEQFHYKNDASSFWQNLNSFNQIIIYGAGVVGKSIAGHIKERGLSIICFAVTNLAGNASEIEKIPVYCIDELEKYMITGIVLVATKDADQPEVIQNLQHRGFRHIIAMDSGLRRVISSSL